MQILIVDTPRLQLVLENTEAVLARIEALSDEHRQEVSGKWLEQLQSNPPSPWTHGFAIVERASENAVGSCAFRGPPGPDGAVEISYIVDETQRGHGYAKEAAAGLVDFALRQGALQVHAHTLAGIGPSTSVLAACGFHHVADIDDAEDGPIWRWEWQRQS